MHALKSHIIKESVFVLRDLLFCTAGILTENYIRLFRAYGVVDGEHINRLCRLMLSGAGRLGLNSAQTMKMFYVQATAMLSQLCGERGKEATQRCILRYVLTAQLYDSFQRVHALVELVASIKHQGTTNPDARVDALLAVCIVARMEFGAKLMQALSSSMDRANLPAITRPFLERINDIIAEGAARISRERSGNSRARKRCRGAIN